MTSDADALADALGGMRINQHDQGGAQQLEQRQDYVYQEPAAVYDDRYNYQHGTYDAAQDMAAPYFAPEADSRQANPYIVWQYNRPKLTFGRYKNWRIDDVAAHDITYLQWMQRQAFPWEVLNVIDNYLEDCQLLPSRQ